MDLIGKLLDLLGTVLWVFVLVCVVGAVMVCGVWWVLWETIAR